MRKRNRSGHGTTPVFDERRGCWVSRVTIGMSPDGKQVRKMVTGATFDEVDRKRAELVMTAQSAKSRLTPLARRNNELLANRTGLYLLPSPEGYVYFVGATNGLVKIGYANDVYSRYSSHQSSSPLPLTLIAAVPGTLSLEKALHILNADRWSHGEWFLMTEGEAKQWASRCAIEALDILKEAGARANHELTRKEEPV